MEGIQGKHTPALASGNPGEVKELVVGRIPYLVCAPYFFDTLDGLENVNFIEGPPADQNRYLADGVIDCAPSSCIEYARNPGAYYIIPGFSTGGRGKIKSVLFLSQVPWEELSGKNVFLSPDSSTSNLLFQILCRRKYQVDPVLNHPEDAVGRVALGNDALTLSHHGPWKYVYDLAEEWYKWQELPFTFGMWMVRKEAAEGKKSTLRYFVDRLHQSRDSFLSDTVSAVDRWLERYPINLPREKVTAFFESADYQMTPRHEKSLLLFFRMAYEGGYSPECKELEFLPETDTAR